MLDEIYRAQAKRLDAMAERHRGAEQKIERYLEAIDEYSKILDKTGDDMRAMAECSKYVAVNYFNSACTKPAYYERAAHYYLQAIQYLHQIAAEDQDYRNLTGLYIDLADACFHSYNQAAAQEASANAITAFNLIKIKYAEESAIGDPTINFKAFYEYFENKSSTVSYRASAAHQNHQHLLLGRYEDQTIAGLFDDFSLDGGLPDAVSGIDEMMKGLGISNAALPSFAPIRLDQPSNDVDFRCMAIEFLRLTQKHMQQGDLQMTMSTYRQARDALTAIKYKSEHDVITIKNIADQIHYLSAQPRMSQAASSQDATSQWPEQQLQDQNEQVSASLISTIGLFAHSTRERLASTEPGDLDLVQEQLQMTTLGSV